MGDNNGFSSIDDTPRCPIDTFSSLSSSMGASHSNCSSFIPIRESLPHLALPRRHSNGSVLLQCLMLHRRVLPKRYMTSPDRITARPAISESFSGVEPGMKGKANTKLPIGTMTVDAITSTLAEPNLTHETKQWDEQIKQIKTERTHNFGDMYSLEDKYHKDIEANIEHEKHIDIERCLKAFIIRMTPGRYGRYSNVTLQPVPNIAWQFQRRHGRPGGHTGRNAQH